jgi:hypothetical protein
MNNHLAGWFSGHPRGLRKHLNGSSLVAHDDDPDPNQYRPRSPDSKGADSAITRRAVSGSDWVKQWRTADLRRRWSTLPSSRRVSRTLEYLNPEEWKLTTCSISARWTVTGSKRFSSRAGLALPLNDSDPYSRPEHPGTFRAVEIRHESNGPSTFDRCSSPSPRRRGARQSIPLDHQRERHIRLGVDPVS